MAERDPDPCERDPALKARAWLAVLILGALVWAIAGTLVWRWLT